MRWCQLHAQNVRLLNNKFKFALKYTVYDHNARPSQTDGQTDRHLDEHHGNSATIRSNERVAR